MPWFDHPSYRPLRDDLVRRFRAQAVAFRRLRHVVFLCGGANSPRRGVLLQYFRQWTPDLLVFQADDVWAKIASLTPDNALAMEAQLAELADAVIIIVESPGTFAELGAFANSPELRAKLLPILDLQYRDCHSFINTGPVRWVDADSLFRPALFVDLDSILASTDHITERLARLPAPSKQRIENLIAYPKHVLFLLRDIVAVVGPATANHVEGYLREIFEKQPPQSVVNLLGLAESLHLVDSKILAVDGSRYFFVRSEDDFRPFVRKRYFNLSNERLKVVSVLQTIDTARSALSLLGH